ncbi:hypothetical protein WBG78_20350 [Chryseolinea sp. T2]|uniref:DUF6933 domain-containing protein n=1 Tax=Chryseolinea sp. T2 TaxID=3129255 RepID=UPI00307816B1
MTIYCSKKLETYLGNVSSDSRSIPTTVFGDFNAHVFRLKIGVCVLVTSNRTCFSVVTRNLDKEERRNFGDFFRERLIRQLDFELKINERQEIDFRSELSDIVICRTNNDRRVMGVMNNFIDSMKYDDAEKLWNDIRVSELLNNSPVGGTIPAPRTRFKDFFIPVHAVRDMMDATGF